MESINFEEILARVQAYVQEISPEQWAIIGGGFLLLLLLNSFRRRMKRRRAARKVAPKFSLHAFQIAPLGKDAFFKIRNNGELATLTNISVKGRNDIVVRNAVGGHLIEKNKVYSILLECNSSDKIKNNFTLRLDYFDQKGNVYRQDFPLRQKVAAQAKLVKMR